MRTAERDRLWTMITDSREGILATINDDGVPQLSNVYYRTDPSTPRISLSTTSRRIKGRNLLRDPRASLHVAGRDFLNFAVAEGDVTLSIPRHPDDPAVDELFVVHEALGVAPSRSGFGDEMIAAHRMVVHLSVTRIYGQIVDR